MWSVSIRRAARPAIAMGAVAWLLAANMPAQAAGLGRPAPPEAAIVPSLAPAAAATPAASVETNLARLHQQLNITPTQQPKFDAFANAMRENARMRPAAPPASPTAVDDLRLTITDTQLELAALRRLLAPMQALYASLSPAQQKTADQLFRQPPGGPAE